MKPDEALKKKQALIKSYKDVFGSPAGRAVLEDLRQRCFYDYPTKPKPGEGEYVMFVNEGARQVFLHIKSRINYNMEHLTLTQEDIK